MKIRFEIFKEQFLNKAVAFAVAVHWTLVLIAFLVRGDLRLPLHFYYESVLLKLITLLDFPALMLAEQIGFPIGVTLTESNISHIAVSVILVTFQWVLIGLFIGKILLNGIGTESSGGEQIGRWMVRKDYWIIFKDAFLSRPVVIIVSLHWILFVIALLIRGDLTSPISFDYESALLNIIFFLDLPGLMAAGLLGFEIIPPMAENDISNLAGAIIFINLQWVLIGFVVGKIWSYAKGIDPSERENID